MNLKIYWYPLGRKTQLHNVNNFYQLSPLDSAYTLLPYWVKIF